MPRNTAYLPPYADIGEVDAARRAFADRLRVRMNQKSWSQSDLARKAGLKRDAISTYINAKRWPDPMSLKKVAKALGCPIEELIPSVASVAAPAPLTVTQDGEHIHITLNQRVSMDQAYRIFAILREENSALPA